MRRGVPAADAERRRIGPGYFGRYFGRRWRGEAPLAAVFWDDMILIGTAVNVAFTLLALVLLSLKAPLALSLAAYFAPAPLNIFLFVAVWRSAARASGAAAAAARIAALIWLLAALSL